MYGMSEKMNQIVEIWETSNTEERQEFLKELHKRYGFQRLCLALSVAPDCELSNTRNYNKQNKFVLTA
jgi:hypothetical protein